MSEKILRWLPLAAIVFFAWWLRSHDLARRPMHADEANQAVKAGELLASGAYAFDPRDHHGPTLYYAALPVAWLRGERSLVALTETTVRLVPAIFGTLTVALVGWLALPLGRGSAAVAAGFAALLPATVYYSRYFIQETLLVTFTLAALIAGVRWWITGGRGWAVAAGTAVGLMLATKANAPLFLGAALVALATIRPPRPAAPRPGRDALVAALTAAVVAAAFYTSFGRHLAGLRDAVTAPFLATGRVTGASGHEKPWWYYLQLLTWQRSGGLVWEQLALCGLAAAGGVLALVQRQAAARFALVYTLVIGVGLSLVPYKTPWHVIHFAPGLAVLAAVTIQAITRLPTGRIVAFLFVALTVVSLGSQLRRVAFTRPAEPRNPYAYVHSSPDVLKYRALATAARARDPERPIRVIGSEYWPLPWYLRGIPAVGYWSTAPTDCDGALVIASAAEAETVRSRLRGTYRESFLGLRPGVLCVVFTPES